MRVQMLVGATCILRDYRREDRTIALAARVSTIHDRSVTVPVWLKSIILRLGDIDWTLGSNFPKRVRRNTN